MVHNFPAKGRTERDVRRKEVLLAQTGLESKVYVLGVPRHPATVQLPHPHHHWDLTTLLPASQKQWKLAHELRSVRLYHAVEGRHHH